MPCKIDQGQRDVFARLLDKFCKSRSEDPSCNTIKEIDCLGDGFYLMNGERREFHLSSSANLDGPIIQKRYHLFGREFELPVRTSKTQRYSISEYIQPTIEDSTGGGSTESGALFCLVPVIGWILCASGCGGDAGTGPGPYMEVGGSLPADVWLDVPFGEEGADTGQDAAVDAADESHDGTGVDKKADTNDAANEADSTADAEAKVPEDIADIVEDDTAPYELPGYDIPPSADDTWQSSYDALGLCFSEATSCTKQAESLCWYINKMNSSKPDTLAFLDPAFDSIDIELEGGPNNAAEEQTFERIDAGTLMENGYFDSTIWLAPGLLLAADYVGETVDIMLSRSDYNAGDLSACEYIYNYPCPGTDVCN
jgi:hypothetical protein